MLFQCTWFKQQFFTVQFTEWYFLLSPKCATQTKVRSDNKYLCICHITRLAVQLGLFTICTGKGNVQTSLQTILGCARAPPYLTPKPKNMYQDVLLLDYSFCLLRSGLCRRTFSCSGLINQSPSSVKLSSFIGSVPSESCQGSSTSYTFWSLYSAACTQISLDIWHLQSACSKLFTNRLTTNLPRQLNIDTQVSFCRQWQITFLPLPDHDGCAVWTNLFSDWSMWLHQCSLSWVESPLEITDKKKLFQMTENWCCFATE